MLAVHPAAHGPAAGGCARAPTGIDVPPAKESRMSSQRQVFRNGFVVSMDPEIGEIPNGEVLVEDGVIVDVGPDLGVSDAEEIGATGVRIMPRLGATRRRAE